MIQHTARWERGRELRLAHGYTQAQIANYLNIPRSTYAGCEINTARIPIAFLPPLAQLYNVSADYLLGFTSVKAPYHKK